MSVLVSGRCVRSYNDVEQEIQKNPNAPVGYCTPYMKKRFSPNIKALTRESVGLSENSQAPLFNAPVLEGKSGINNAFSNNKFITIFHSINVEHAFPFKNKF